MTHQDLGDVKAMLETGGLGNAATARGAIECACRKIAQAEDGSTDQLAALEALEQCLVADEGVAMAMSASSEGYELLLTLSVRAEKQSPHQLSALSCIANLSAASSEVRVTVTQAAHAHTLLCVCKRVSLRVCTHACAVVRPVVIDPRLPREEEVRAPVD